MKNEIFPEMQLSKKVCEIPEALSIYFNQLVYSQKRRGLDIIVLSLGEAYFDIPLFDFSKLNVEKCYHYSESQGIPELRKKICDYYQEKYGAEIDAKSEILISTGSKPLLYMAIQSVINPGDEVLIHEPAWLSYQEQIKLAEGIPKFIPYDCEISKFNIHFTHNTKMVIINNPNNPAGWEYSKENLLSIYEQCRKRGIYVLVDEAYSDFIEKNKFYSMATVIPNKDGIIVVNSLSKNMGISGWRVGYVIAEPRVIRNILKLNQHLITCAPTILLLYLERYFDDIIKITLPQAENIIKKRNKVKEYIKQIGLKCLKGSSTFYFFINIGNFSGTSIDFCLFLLFKYNIAAVPGSAYGERTERFIRVGIGTESEERIYYALDIIKDVIYESKFDSDYLNEKLKLYGYYKFEVCR
jgi:aspartate aminotransferase/aminotransferase